MSDFPLIAPSLLACDFLHLKDEIDAVTKAGADLLHLDIMDGHYVPNLTFGPEIVKAIREISQLVLDVHLMVKEPQKFVEWFIDAGADWISIHPESDDHPYRTLNYIQKRGKKAGVALNPGTSWQCVEPLIDVIDYVLIMSVNPGYGGQSFIPSTLSKIKHIRALNPNILIEIDGGVSENNVAALKKEGVNVFVAGTSIFKKETLSMTQEEKTQLYKKRILKLKTKAE